MVITFRVTTLRIPLVLNCGSYRLRGWNPIWWFARQKKRRNSKRKEMKGEREGAYDGSCPPTQLIWKLVQCYSSGDPEVTEAGWLLQFGVTSSWRLGEMTSRADTHHWLAHILFGQWLVYISATEAATKMPKHQERKVEEKKKSNP